MTRRADGFALILVIWALVLLASVATGFAYAVRHETRTAGDLASQARAEATNAAALRVAVLALTADDPDTAWAADARPHEIHWPEAASRVRVRAEGSRIDLNAAPRRLLVGLFAQRLADADPEALADAVIDWRDENDQPEPSGAEKTAYARAGYAYGPPNRPFQSVSELSQVMGFRYDYLEAVAPYLTVYSHWARVHAESAEEVVLGAVPGIDRAQARDFVAQRDKALAEGKPVNFSLLKGGLRDLETRARSRVVAVEIETRLDDGTALAERSVIQLGGAEGFSVLTREQLPTAGPPGDAR